MYVQTSHDSRLRGFNNPEQLLSGYGPTLSQNSHGIDHLQKTKPKTTPKPEAHDLEAKESIFLMSEAESVFSICFAISQNLSASRRWSRLPHYYFSDHFPFSPEAHARLDCIAEFLI